MHIQQQQLLQQQQQQLQAQALHAQKQSQQAFAAQRGVQVISLFYRTIILRLSKRH
jgi:hypothetical protein